MTPITKFAASLVLAVAAVAVGPTAGTRAGAAGDLVPLAGTYGWPVNGPVIRGFEPPPNPYSSGHRGIDIAAPFGSTLRSAGDGVVAFAGWVGGSLFISIDHPDGIRTTYSWLSAIGVRKGQSVVKGQVIGATGHGHPEIPQPHLHFGARVGTTYIDPMLLLEPQDVSGFVHLAPLDGPNAREEAQLEAFLRWEALAEHGRDPPQWTRPRAAGLRRPRRP